jgi:hypothetical protein
MLSSSDLFTVDCFPLRDQLLLGLVQIENIGMSHLIKLRCFHFLILTAAMDKLHLVA